MTAVSVGERPFTSATQSLRTEINLRKGMILTMSDLQAAYLWENSLKQTMSMRMYAIEKRENR